MQSVKKDSKEFESRHLNFLTKEKNFKGKLP